MISLDTIQYLCLSTGGTNGLVFVGVLKALETEFCNAKLNFYSHLQGVSGASIGSLIGTAIVLGFNSNEIRTIWQTWSEKYQDRLHVNVLELMSHKGLISPSVIEDVVNELMITKYGPDAKGFTFADLFHRTHKILAIAVYNLSTQHNEILDHQSTPALSIAKAVSMSCAIPFIFRPVEYNQCMYTDPGISNPLPYNVFPINKSLICYLSGVHEYKTMSDVTLPDFVCRVFHGFDSYVHQRIESHGPDVRQRFIYLKIPCYSTSAVNGFRVTAEQMDRLVTLGLNGALSAINYKTALMSQALYYCTKASKFILHGDN
jgi:hypothetical protein